MVHDSPPELVNEFLFILWFYSSFFLLPSSITSFHEWLSLFSIEHFRFSIASSSFFDDFYFISLYCYRFLIFIVSVIYLFSASLDLLLSTPIPKQRYLFYFPNQLFFTSTLPDSDPLGTFLNLNFGAPHGGHLYDLSSSFAHAAGPLVYT